MAAPKREPAPPLAVTRAIEQARARGWSVYRIAAELDLPVSTVLAVRDKQNRVARETGTG